MRTLLVKLGFLDFNKPVYVPYPVYLPSPDAKGKKPAAARPGAAPGAPVAPVHHRHRHHKHGSLTARHLFGG